STALSVDEMMVRFFGRTSLKQYLPCKPDRYGIKLWGLCAANGYLFNLDVYCGKNDPSIGINLLACALDSRVVLQMINPLLSGLSRKKLSDYHLYFDNFFTSPDLLIHLHNCGLRSTGTVRKDSVKEKHEFAKSDPRGSMWYHFITPMKRFSRAAQERVELGFPRAFSLYNNYMGGVDLHDFRCKKASPSITSKKWT
ncbi:piggyBac transposable element-derived protein 3-like, partial [Belonocnema kinseyi]|uniref:piggyBac transposable element-derived protein 3-like n=1 Tax=Belonocnema kinseyi TaxID=2817044 RepID=UPI00143DD65D